MQSSTDKYPHNVLVQHIEGHVGTTDGIVLLRHFDSLTSDSHQGLKLISDESLAAELEKWAATKPAFNGLVLCLSL